MATILLNEPTSPGLSPADDLTSSADFPDVNPHIHLSERDSRLFADLMEADEEPADALLQAARQYQQTINRQNL